MTNPKLDLGPLLSYMKRCGPSGLTFGDIKVGEGDPRLPMDLDIQRFYVTLPGHVEVEFWMRDNEVLHLQVRQAAMTLAEIMDNGDVQPTVNIAVSTLPDSQQEDVQQLADQLLNDGRVNVSDEAQKALMRMTEKVLFPPGTAITVT